MYVLNFDLANPFWWLSSAMIVFNVFAFVDAATRREDAYRAADKKTKQFWLIILGIAAGIAVLLGASPLSFISLIGLVAAIVYMVDVRPAIKQLTDGGRGGNRQNQGPYGPW